MLKLLTLALGLVFMAATARAAGTNLSDPLARQIKHAMQLARHADESLGNETMFSSSLPAEQQKQIVAAGKRHFAVALREYRRVLSLTGRAGRQGIDLPPSLAERALSRAAWGLRPLVLGNDRTRWTLRREMSAIKLFPNDPQPYVFVSEIFHAEALLVPFGENGTPDPRTGKMHWVKAHPTPEQRKRRLHYLRASARFAELAIRLAPRDTMANYLLWQDLTALKLDAKGRGFYLAVAVAGRQNIRPIDMHYNVFRIKNLAATLGVFGRWERNPIYKRMLAGEGPSKWPVLPEIPSAAPVVGHKRHTQ